MRGKIPDDADVGLVKSEVYPARRDGVDLTELAGQIISRILFTDGL